MSAHRSTLAALRSRADAWRKSQEPHTPAYAAAYEANLATWFAGLPRETADSWQNLLTGHGTGRDKTTFTTFEPGGRLSFAELEALYHDEDLAARIVDAEPEEMWREGFDLALTKVTRQDALGAMVSRRGDFASLEDELAEHLQTLGAQEAFLEAGILGRLYGGSAIYVGADDGRPPNMPLVDDAVRGVPFLHVLDRYSLWPNTFYGDINSPKFGKPETYRIFRAVQGGLVTGGPVVAASNDVVHETRLILFPGARTTLRRRVANFSWDDSVLQRCHAVLCQFGLSWAAATHLLSDASQGVYKLKHLLDMIAGGQKEALLERMALADETRSTARMLLVDADEESFERTPTPFSGIPEMLDRVVQRLAAAARTPVTVLMGMSPAGLNATGESDMRQWYDRIRARQQNDAAPRLQRLIRLLLLARGERTLAASVRFRPLWQPTALEEADRRLKIAQTDDIYLAAGVVLEEEIRESRFGGDGYSAETTIDQSLGVEALQAIKEARVPPPPAAPGLADAPPAEE